MFTDQGIYCYKVMPFGLKTLEQLSNVWSTRFSKSRSNVPWRYTSMTCLWRTSGMPTTYNTWVRRSTTSKSISFAQSQEMYLQSSLRKFLGYLVTQRGIEDNPDQISIILSMKSPTCVNEVQMLNGRLATLNRFLSRFTNKCKLSF